MYCINGTSCSSLLIESTDSMTTDYRLYDISYNLLVRRTSLLSAYSSVIGTMNKKREERMMIMMTSIMQQAMAAISGFGLPLVPYGPNIGPSISGVRYQPGPPAPPPTSSPQFSIDVPDSPFHVPNCSESLIYIYMFRTVTQPLSRCATGYPVIQPDIQLRNRVRHDASRG